MNEENLVWVGLVVEIDCTITLSAMTFTYGGLATGTVNLQLANQKYGKKRSFTFAEELLLITEPPGVQVVISEDSKIVFRAQPGQQPSLMSDAAEERVIINLLFQQVVLAISHTENNLYAEIAGHCTMPILPMQRKTRGENNTVRFRLSADIAEKIRSTFL